MNKRLQDTNLWNQLIWFCNIQKKWTCVSVHRPPFYNNFIVFFKKLTKFACMVLNTYDNVLLVRDFNIDVIKI